MNLNDQGSGVHDSPDGPHYEALRRGEIHIQRCDRCGYLRWAPAERCPECWSCEATWTPVEGAGRLWSSTTYRRALHPDFTDVVPYTVGLVNLECGVAMIGPVPSWQEAPPGTALRAEFRAVDGDVVRLAWVVAQ